MIKLPRIEKTSVNIEDLSEIKNESHFVQLSVSILAETGSYVCLLASLLPPLTHSWDTNQAVLGGHFVRLSKLIQAVLDQTCQKKRETSFLFARMAFECVVNITFILRNYSPNLLLSYKTYSLQHEKKLFDRINKNIEKREGRVLAIEERMLVSIERAFRLSGVNKEDVEPRAQRNWGGKNIYEKAKSVELGDAYFACFSGPSHGIHGNWQDLQDYHLTPTEDGRFIPKLNWRVPRPQHLNAVAFHSSLVAQEYLNWLDSEGTDKILSSLEDLANRISRLDKCHEEWIQNNANDKMQ